MPLGTHSAARSSKRKVSVILSVILLPTVGILLDFFCFNPHSFVSSQRCILYLVFQVLYQKTSPVLTRNQSTWGLAGRRFIARTFTPPPSAGAVKISAPSERGLALVE